MIRYFVNNDEIRESFFQDLLKDMKEQERDVIIKMIIGDEKGKIPKSKLIKTGKVEKLKSVYPEIC